MNFDEREGSQLKSIKIALPIIVACLALVAACAVFDHCMAAESSDTGFAMDTVVTVRVRAREPQELVAKTIAAINNLSREIDRFDNSSSVYDVNEAHAAVYVPHDVYEIVEKALRVCKKSGGVFDITMGAVSDLWGFNTGVAALPDEEELARAVAAKGCGKLIANDDKLTVPEGMLLDLGSVGKGAACNIARKTLTGSGANGAVVSVGGSILLYGKSSYTVGVRDPFGTVSDYAAVLTLKDTCISTSGSYERFIELDGVRYHHILDPATGKPVENNLMSVTAVCRDGELSDALSTACFVLGIEDGTALARQFGAEVLFITQDRKIYYTDGLEGHIEVTGDGFEAAEL